MEKYDIVNPEGAALKASILIDENFIVRHQGVNDHPLVRNLDEMQRIDDALNFIVIMERYAQPQERMEGSSESLEEYLLKVLLIFNFIKNIKFIISFFLQ